jgi:hypothetical protein
MPLRDKTSNAGLYRTFENRVGGLQIAIGEGEAHLRGAIPCDYGLTPWRARYDRLRVRLAIARRADAGVYALPGNRRGRGAFYHGLDARGRIRLALFVAVAHRVQFARNVPRDLRCPLGERPCKRLRPSIPRWIVRPWTALPLQVSVGRKLQHCRLLAAVTPRRKAY